MPSAAKLHRYFLIAAVTSVTLWITFFFGVADGETLSRIFLHTAFPMVAVSTLLAGATAATLCARNGMNWRGIWRENRWFLALALGLTLIMTLTLGRAFRVMDDEPTLVGQSLALFRFHRPDVIMQLIRDHGADYIIDTEIPQRPLFYPFLMAVMHQLAGYSADHGFAVNALACIVTLAAICALGRRLIAPTYGLIAAALTAAFPMYQLAVASSGYDALNLCIIVLALLLLHAFLTSPSAGKFELLVFLGVLGAQCRHESVLIFLPIAAAFFLRRKVLERPPWLALAAPLLLTPFVCQKLIVRATNAVDETVAPFSWRYVWPHVQSIFAFHFDPAGAGYPTSRVAVVLAVFGGIGLVRGRSPKSPRAPRARVNVEFACLTGLCIAAMALAQCAYYLGDLRSGPQMRFSLIYLSFIPLLAALPLYRLARSHVGRLLAFVVVSLGFGLGLSAAATDPPPEQRSDARFNEVAADLKAFPPASTLVISETPWIYIALGYQAIDAGYANKHVDSIVAGASRQDFKDIVFVEFIDSATGKSQDDPLSARFHLRTLRDFWVSKQLTVRLDQVDLFAPAPPSAKEAERWPRDVRF